MLGIKWRIELKKFINNFLRQIVPLAVIISKIVFLWLWLDFVEDITYTNAMRNLQLGAFYLQKRNHTKSSWSKKLFSLGNAKDAYLIEYWNLFYISCYSFRVVTLFNYKFVQVLQAGGTVIKSGAYVKNKHHY